MNNITKEKVSETWQKVFPNSRVYIKNHCLGEGFSCYCTLAKDKSETIHNILENDPLNYSFSLYGNDYEEYSSFIHIKPENQYLAYSSKRIRKKNIKNLTIEKLEKRFLQVKQLVVDNKENFINLKFDISEKIS